MTWTRLDDNHFAGTAQLALCRNARLLHIEGLVYANANLTDGFIPAVAMRIVTDDPDAIEDVRSLVGAGIWTDAVDGYQIVDFTEKQMSREDVEKVQELWAARQRRQRQHRLGDHSGCDSRYCTAARVTRDSRSDGAVSHGTPIRPATTRTERSEGRGEAGVSGSLAFAVPPPRQGMPVTILDHTDSGTT